MASKRQRRSLKLTSPQDISFVKSSRRLEAQRHKLTTKHELIQAGLWESYLEDGREKESPFQEMGLELSVAEDRALLAILKLLEETDYKGNGDPVRIVPTDFGINQEVLLPVLNISFSQYLDAYGPLVSGKWRVKQRVFGERER
jgi:hypothetical protein